MAAFPTLVNSIQAQNLLPDTAAEWNRGGSRKRRTREGPAFFTGTVKREFSVAAARNVDSPPPLMNSWAA
jgi:hypothetical protein